MYFGIVLKIILIYKFLHGFWAEMTIRTLALKKKLSKALKRAWPVPAWVIVKTKRRFRTHSKSRHWRRSGKIKT